MVEWWGLPSHQLLRCRPLSTTFAEWHIRASLSKEREHAAVQEVRPCAEEQTGGEDPSGHNTALTRRGLIVVLLSCDFARKGQERQWPMRAAYNTRRESFRSGRRS